MLRPEAVFSGGSARQVAREKGSLFYLPLMQIILKFGILFVSDTIWLPFNSDDRGHVLVKVVLLTNGLFGHLFRCDLRQEDVYGGQPDQPNRAD